MKLRSIYSLTLLVVSIFFIYQHAHGLCVSNLPESVHRMLDEEYRHKRAIAQLNRMLEQGNASAALGAGAAASAQIPTQLPNKPAQQTTMPFGTTLPHMLRMCAQRLCGSKGE